MSNAVNAKCTRRRFLVAAAAWVALGNTLSCEWAKSARAGQAWSFRSRPDLSPPVIEVTTQARDTAPGHIFVAPKNGPGEAGPGQDGCLVLDNTGEPIWFRPVAHEAMDVMDFKLQRYRGHPVLTWWEGKHTGYGQGEYVLLDDSYREVARVRAGNGYEGDHHEFLISPQDTALFTIYDKVHGMNLSSAGGPEASKVLDGIVQEVDIESGEVLFEWHSLEHVSLDESYDKPYDYYHINSVDVDHDSNLLISARKTSTVYKIDRKSGNIIWRLGGKKSDFEMGPGTGFAYQHDARRQPDGTLTIFDNGYMNEGEQSRGIVLELDEKAMTAKLVREYTHPDKVRAATQGSIQVLPNENVFVGWGSNPFFTEFSKDGDLLFNATFPAEGESYRAFRFPWSGQPDDDPALAAERKPYGEVTLYASWNGATEVATWEVLAGSNPESLEAVASAPREGFETTITLKTAEAYVGVRAKNGSGKVLGTAEVVKPSD